MSKVCKFLLNEIHFVVNRIVPCFTTFWEQEGNVEKYFIKADSNTSINVLNSYFSLREKYINMYKNGEIPEFCKNCRSYEPVEINENEKKFYFDRIAVKNRSKCSCRCIYCCLTGENDDIERFKAINSEKTYEIKPFLEYMDRENLVNENTQIDVLGGECTEYPEELEYIINFGLKYNCKFQILTNGIIYNENIEKIIKNNTTNLVCSIDSGSKEIFEKIKRVKAFDRVVNNITNYVIAGKDNPNVNIMLKYILCPGINDSLVEVKKFFELAKSCGVKTVIFSIDRFWQSANANKKVPENIKKIVKYFITHDDFPEMGAAVDYGFVYKWWVDKILENNEESEIQENCISDQQDSVSESKTKLQTKSKNNPKINSVINSLLKFIKKF